MAETLNKKPLWQVINEASGNLRADEKFGDLMKDRPRPRVLHLSLTIEEPAGDVFKSLSSGFGVRRTHGDNLKDDRQKHEDDVLQICRNLFEQLTRLHDRLRAEADHVTRVA